MNYNLNSIMLRAAMKKTTTKECNGSSSGFSSEGNLTSVQKSSVQWLSCVRFFVIPWTAAWHHQLLEFTQTCVHWFGEAIQTSPASFRMNQFFSLGGQRIEASASVLPKNIQDWLLLGWTGWISLQSKGLSRLFSNTTVSKDQFFGTQLSL